MKLRPVTTEDIVGFVESETGMRVPTPDELEHELFKDEPSPGVLEPFDRALAMQAAVKAAMLPDLTSQQRQAARLKARPECINLRDDQIAKLMMLPRNQRRRMLADLRKEFAKIRAQPDESDECVCGHPYGDHSANGKHHCLANRESMLDRGACERDCAAFKAKLKFPPGAFFGANHIIDECVEIDDESLRDMVDAVVGEVKS